MSVAKVMVLGGAGMLGHKTFQILRERFAGAFCTIWEDIRKPPFDRVELLQGNDVIPGVDVTAFLAPGAHSQQLPVTAHLDALSETCRLELVYQLLAHAPDRLFQYISVLHYDNNLIGRQAR